MKADYSADWFSLQLRIKLITDSSIKTATTNATELRKPDQNPAKNTIKFQYLSGHRKHHIYAKLKP